MRDTILTSGITTVVQALQLEGSGLSHVVWSGTDSMRIEHLPMTTQFAGPIPTPEENVPVKAGGYGPTIAAAIAAALDQLDNANNKRKDQG